MKGIYGIRRSNHREPVNALNSTGPRTSEGKARVSRNATSHGLTARHLVIRDDEREEFTAFHEVFSAELDPQGVNEAIVFQELLHAAWNLQRFSRIEAEVSSGTAEDFPDAAAVAILRPLDPLPIPRPARVL